MAVAVIVITVGAEINWLAVGFVSVTVGGVFAITFIEVVAKEPVNPRLSVAFA